MLKFFKISTFLFIALSGFAQSYNFDGQWEYLGPDDKPYSERDRNDAGIGPVEFIRVSSVKEGHLLAGALHGGLFYSEDGGETWINSGSDRWPYSACGWADYYPGSVSTWFAYSNESGDNGKPGKMGDHGGIYRTTDKGLNWQHIGGKQEFGSQYVKIYGTRFHPDNPKMLFVMSTNGLFYTNNCLEQKVQWNRVEGIEGWIYDMDFIGDKMYLSNLDKNKWDILEINLHNWSEIKKIETKDDEMRNITFEPGGKDLYILIDSKKGRDALWLYSNETQKAEIIAENQMVNFGSGHTFAVSPFNQNELFIGSSITIRKWTIENGKMKSGTVGSDFHVDVEFVAYDPYDTNKVYIATHGGVYVSNDQGKSWDSKSKGLGVAEVMGLAVSKTDPNQVVIGCFHDGSSVYADFDKNGKYYWKIVNGGDALIPLIHPHDPAIVYTSNQYSGGGIYFSDDTARTITNIHRSNKLQTSGWEMAAVLHPSNPDILFFNFKHNKGENKGSNDISRTRHGSQAMKAEIISNFKKSHGLDSYIVYGLFNSYYYPDHLYAYVLNPDKDENGKSFTRHRLFKTEIANDSADKVIDSWTELDLPRNSWIADVEVDPDSQRIIYVSYTTAIPQHESVYGEKGMFYALKFTKKNKLKREMDITRNIPDGLVGRYNMVVPFNNKKEIFVVTGDGVFYGSKKQMKGKRVWQAVGFGLPHCKPYGIDFNEKSKTLTVGLFGRGVWRYRM